MPDDATSVLDAQTDSLETNDDLELDSPVEDLSPESMPDSSPGVDKSAEPAQSAKVDFPPDLIALAARYNISAAEARQFGSPDGLRAGLRTIDVIQKRHQESERTKAAATPKEKPAFKYKLDLPQEVADAINSQTDPRFLQHIQGMNDHYAQMIEKMYERVEASESTLAEFRSKEEARQAEEFTADADDFFGSLGPEGEALFGKGDAWKIQAESPEMFENRMRVLRMYEGLLRSPETAALYGRDQKKVMKAAYRAAFADHADSIAQAAVAGKVVARSKQIVGRPGRKVEPAAVGSEAAEKQVIARWARDNNVPLDESQDFEL